VAASATKLQVALKLVHLPATIVVPKDTSLGTALVNPRRRYATSAARKDTSPVIALMPALEVEEGTRVEAEAEEAPNVIVAERSGT